MKKNRMNLRIFENSGGAGAGEPGGSARGDNNNQNNAGSGGQPTYSYAQAEEIANARAERAERSALKSYFQQQGMSEEQVNQAITDYKAQQKKNQPNIEQMQRERDAALKEAQQMKQEKFLSGKGVKAEDVDYVMFKVSKLVDDKTTFEKAAEKYLKENPRFVGGSSYRVSTSTGSDSNGSGGNVNASINDAIRAAARR